MLTPHITKTTHVKIMKMARSIKLTRQKHLLSLVEIRNTNLVTWIHQCLWTFLINICLVRTLTVIATRPFKHPPATRHSLFTHVRYVYSIESFKLNLKTCFFRLAFIQWWFVVSFYRLMNIISESMRWDLQKSLVWTIIHLNRTY